MRRRRTAVAVLTAVTGSFDLLLGVLAFRAGGVVGREGDPASYEDKARNWLQVCSFLLLGRACFAGAFLAVFAALWCANADAAAEVADANAPEVRLIWLWIRAGWVFVLFRVSLLSVGAALRAPFFSSASPLLVVALLMALLEVTTHTCLNYAYWRAALCVHSLARPLPAPPPSVTRRSSTRSVCGVTEEVSLVVAAV